MVKPNGILNLPDLNYIIIRTEDQIFYYPGLGTQKKSGRKQTCARILWGEGGWPEKIIESARRPLPNPFPNSEELLSRRWGNPRCGPRTHCIFTQTNVVKVE